MPSEKVVLQADAPSDALAIAFVVAYLLLIAVTITVSFFLYRDAKQRGANAGGWVLGFVVASLLLGLIGWGLFALFYFLMRPKQILYDRQGHPLLPPGPVYAAPPPPGWSGTQTTLPGYAPTPQTAPPPWPQPAPPSDPYGPRPGSYMAPRPPMAPSPPMVGAKAAKVKCPRCQTIFDYYAAPAGPTHVKCPACGDEGNI